MLKCSHILFKSKELKQTVNHFNSLGFTTSWGSNPKKAQNAFVWFEEGPFIEIIHLPAFAMALTPLFRLLKGKIAASRWKKWLHASEGWCDIALEPTRPEDAFDLTQIRQSLLAQGIGASKIIKGKRVRPDGLEVRYSFMCTKPSPLPFVVSLYNTPQRPSNITHKNGVQCISDVNLLLRGEEISLFEKLCKNDPWIRPIEGENTKIEVIIDGFSSSITGTSSYLENKMQIDNG
ncbi:MAG: VOC family protein [Bacteroidota bacterium]